jgi:DNA-binding NtrC family response regulator
MVHDVDLGRNLITHGYLNGASSVLRQVAHTNATVVIRGEPGVGKGLVAALIHAASPRCRGPFITVSCASRHRDGLDSELFGHEKGAFPDAFRRKPGRFEFAHMGTIFVRQVDALAGPSRARFLRTLECSGVQRLGGDGSRPVDVRVVASCTTRPAPDPAEAAIREALSRLDAVEISIVPLRDRRQCVPELAAALLTRFRQAYRRQTVLLSETVDLLTEYSWPGNVRELVEVLERFVIVDDPRRNHEEFKDRLARGVRLRLR